jgi:hypothetical protein
MGRRQVSKKAQRKRIERLEALVRSKKIEDAKRRHAESFAKMTDEEVASFGFAVQQIAREKNPPKTLELFRGGLAATEYFDEKGRLGWRAFCETGGQAAVVDFSDAHEDDEGSATRTPGLKGDPKVLGEGLNLGNRRTKNIKLHRARLAGQEPEQKKDSSENDTPSRPKDESGGDDA